VAVEQKRRILLREDFMSAIIASSRLDSTVATVDGQNEEADQ